MLVAAVFLSLVSLIAASGDPSDFLYNAFSLQGPTIQIDRFEFCGCKQKNILIRTSRYWQTVTSNGGDSDYIVKMQSIVTHALQKTFDMFAQGNNTYVFDNGFTQVLGAVDGQYYLDITAMTGEGTLPSIFLTYCKDITADNIAAVEALIRQLEGLEDFALDVDNISVQNAICYA